MDTSLILIIIGLLGVFHLISVITLKNKMEALEVEIKKNKGCLKKIDAGIVELDTTIKLGDGKSQGRLEEGIQRIKEAGEIIEGLGYEVNGIRELITSTAKDLEKTVKTEAGRILFTPLKIKYEEKGV